jgi:hypothetical protein
MLAVSSLALLRTRTYLGHPSPPAPRHPSTSPITPTASAFPNPRNTLARAQQPTTEAAEPRCCDTRRASSMTLFDYDASHTLTTRPSGPAFAANKKVSALPLLLRIRTYLTHATPPAPTSTAFAPTEPSTRQCVIRFARPMTTTRRQRQRQRSPAAATRIFRPCLDPRDLASYPNVGCNGQDLRGGTQQAENEAKPRIPYVRPHCDDLQILTTAPPASARQAANMLRRLPRQHA